MSILIRGMEMLKEETVIVIDSSGQVWSNEWPTRGYTRLDGVTAVPVPPHGDLIDRDTALDSLMNGMVMTGYQSRAMDCLNEMYVPTIIPAEEGK